MPGGTVQETTRWWGRGFSPKYCRVWTRLSRTRSTFSLWAVKIWSRKTTSPSEYTQSDTGRWSPWPPPSYLWSSALWSIGESRRLTWATSLLSSTKQRRERRKYVTPSHCLNFTKERNIVGLWPSDRSSPGRQSDHSMLQSRWRLSCLLPSPDLAPLSVLTLSPVPWPRVPGAQVSLATVTTEPGTETEAAHSSVVLVPARVPGHVRHVSTNWCCSTSPPPSSSTQTTPSSINKCSPSVIEYLSQSWFRSVSPTFAVLYLINDVADHPLTTNGNFVKNKFPSSSNFSIFWCSYHYDQIPQDQEGSQQI